MHKECIILNTINIDDKNEADSYLLYDFIGKANLEADC